MWVGSWGDVDVEVEEYPRLGVAGLLGLSVWQLAFLTLMHSGCRYSEVVVDILVLWLSHRARGKPFRGEWHLVGETASPTFPM